MPLRLPKHSSEPVRATRSFNMLPTLPVCTDTNESCVIQVSFSERDLHILVIYRPTQISCIDVSVEQITFTLHDDVLHGKKYVVAGDLKILYFGAVFCPH